MTTVVALGLPTGVPCPSQKVSPHRDFLHVLALCGGGVSWVPTPAGDTGCCAQGADGHLPSPTHLQVPPSDIHLALLNGRPLGVHPAFGHSRLLPRGPLCASDRLFPFLSSSVISKVAFEEMLASTCLQTAGPTCSGLFAGFTPALVPQHQVSEGTVLPGSTG